MTYTEACIAINMIPRMGPVRLRKLLGVFETPQRILEARSGDLLDFAGRDLAEAISSWEKTVDLEGELKRIAAFGAKVLTAESPVYPRLLREIHNPPIVLYAWGEVTDRDRHAISIVGSRQTSQYGLECAKKFSYQLAYAGYTVVSGLARGIDTAAHQGALAAKGRTIAVLGSGLNRLYPEENRALAEKIAASGAVVTEFPMETQPDQQSFPQRNRIVSGWASGLLVVEAGAHSGALITANQAAEQGRTVFAVPGPINRPTCAGTNRLIQEGAKLVTGVRDILEEMETLFPDSPHIMERAQASEALAGEEKAIYDSLGEAESTLEDLVAKCGLPMRQVSSTLLTLEMKRYVKQLPGRLFVRLS